MSSWFGGPASATHTKHHSSQSEGAFVRSSGKRSPSPKRYFVRSHSPSAQSTRSFSSFFGGRHNSSSSYYKRRPRDGFISRILSQIKRYLRDIIDYVKRNPMKALLLIMPLITGGALAGIMKSVGIQLPASIAGFMGAGKSASAGFGAGAASEGIGLEQVMNVAKMFI